MITLLTVLTLLFLATTVALVVTLNSMIAKLEHEHYMRQYYEQRAEMLYLENYHLKEKNGHLQSTDGK